ncbi:hypothetical protein RJ641_007848 [Dillenia turbinata]|uniref:PDZ domain-containing protein n=1 Tax=Dillenia turbinata TaxID=194707 RepID=A0AAN8Z4F1_9MAGN
MSSAAVVTGASSSCSAFTRTQHSIKTSNPTPNAVPSHFQKVIAVLALLVITARTAGASKQIEVEVDKPLGLTLGQKPGGGVVITAVDGGGNAARAGLKAGDQVLYTSSFFGDELWPADKLGFTKTAVQAKPDSVYFVVSRGAEVNVKRLPKRPAPPRFGRKLTESQKAREAALPDTYVCPQCQAPKKRFAGYDVNTGKPIGGGLPPIGVIIGLLAGVGAVGALLVYGLQ